MTNSGVDYSSVPACIHMRIKSWLQSETGRTEEGGAGQIRMWNVSPPSQIRSQWSSMQWVGVCGYKLDLEMMTNCRVEGISIFLVISSAWSCPFRQLCPLSSPRATCSHGIITITGVHSAFRRRRGKCVRGSFGALEQPCLCPDYENTIALDKHFYRPLTIRNK